MKRNMRSGCKALLLLLSLLTLIESTDAQTFVFQNADLCIGFRKTGNYKGLYEAVVDIGQATNYINLPAGTTTNITAYTPTQLDPDSYPNLTNLSWSITGTTYASGQPAGYPNSTLWVTVPRPSPGVLAAPPIRAKLSSQEQNRSLIESIPGAPPSSGSISGAFYISSLQASNQDNTATFVQEPYAIANNENYGVWIEDPNYPTIGDLGAGGGIANTNGSVINLENTTLAPFTTGVQSDLYELRPTGTVDPHTGMTTGVGYDVGYFQLNPDGTMSFTRASSVSAPTVGTVTSTVTNGFSPLTVVFTNSASGSISTWVWNFGNGDIITNTTGANVTNTYDAAGDYTVTLTVNGPGGSSTATLANYIVASPAPAIGTSWSGGLFTLSGANCPPGAQYRILTSTNVALPLADWTQVLTNTFTSSGMFAFTNPATTNGSGFFRLISP